jgi:hypothetical protein
MANVQLVSEEGEFETIAPENSRGRAGQENRRYKRRDQDEQGGRQALRTQIEITPFTGVVGLPVSLPQRPRELKEKRDSVARAPLIFFR